MSTVLVTGSAGLIGSHIVKELLNFGHKVISIDNLSGGLPENLVEHCNHQFLYMDLLDLHLGEVFKSFKPEIVVSCAAVATEGASHFRKRFIYQNNVEINLNLINCSVNFDVKKYIFLSSMAVYGGYQKPPFDEMLDPRPEDTYGNAKLVVERELKITHDFFKQLEYVIIRPHNFASIGQNIFDRYRNVLGIWVRQGLQRQPISVFGDGLQRRAFSYTPDGAKAMVNAIFSDKCNYEIINVGGMKPYTILEAAEIVHKHFPDSPIEHLQTRYEVRDAWCSYEKSQRLLDYKDTVTLEDNIAEMVEWAKTLKIREVQSWDNYEIDKKLYDFWK